MKKNSATIWYILPGWWPWLAVALVGIIIAKRGRVLSKKVINHERIHFAQQRELWVLPFFLLYVLEFLFRLIEYRFRWMDAYENISFEREAFSNDLDFSYLDTRKPWAWLKHL
jgi:hypothetical protein